MAADIGKVVIVIKGGLVQDIQRPENVPVEILDLDTERGIQEDLCACSMADIPHWHSGYGGDWLD
jgi:hypothetical protein